MRGVCLLVVLGVCLQISPSLRPQLLQQLPSSSLVNFLNLGHPRTSPLPTYLHSLKFHLIAALTVSNLCTIHSNSNNLSRNSPPLLLLHLLHHLHPLLLPASTPLKPPSL